MNRQPDGARAIKLQVDRLSKTYGAVTALADAALSVHEGEFVSLLGPSGSGKTTLLMLVAGIVQPTDGEVWIDGRLATYLPPHKRDIGVVFQNYALFPHLTIRENIAFPLQMRKQSGVVIDKAVDKALDTVQLSHVADRYPRELSGGQQQRIALARCIVYQPSIILMDEPLGALDRKLRDQMQLEIKQLHKKLGITVVYVTHDQDEAMTMSDRICLMNNARIEQIGSPEGLYYQPRSLFVADFLGDSNILDCTVMDSMPNVVLKLADNSVVRSPPSGSARPGDKLKLVVRPENLSLLRNGGTAENTIEGQVVESTFMGGVCRTFIALSNGTKICLKELSKVGALRHDVQPGQPVMVGWDVKDSILLSPTPTEAP